MKWNGMEWNGIDGMEWNGTESTVFFYFGIITEIIK